eukprot:9208714-Pyramimonas_sp.AAC.1
MLRIASPCQSPLQDFEVPLRVDLDAGRDGDAPRGKNPAVLVVRGGVVDISGIAAIYHSDQCPKGR